MQRRRGKQDSPSSMLIKLLLLQQANDVCTASLAVKTKEQRPAQAMYEQKTATCSVAYTTMLNMVSLYTLLRLLLIAKL
jgi:hypothetical protein